MPRRASFARAHAHISYFFLTALSALAALVGSGCPGEVTPPPSDAGADAPLDPDAPGVPEDTGAPRLDAGPDAPAGCADPDADGDGRDAIACGGDDCDDADPNRAPGRIEVCDATDHDEDCDPTTFGVRDGDGDGEPDAACCNVDATGASFCGTDCDDVRASVAPGAVEVCNGRDDDCDGALDDGVEITFYGDEDGDGFGRADVTVTACSAPAGHVATPGDCDDLERNVNPARGEVCGNLVDDNCNGAVDETGTATFYADTDRDGRGDPAAPMTFAACSAPVGYAPIAGDCDDTVATTYEGAPELCNGVDDGCDLVGGRGGPDPAEDTDGDGHAEIGLCTGGPLPADDCDDGRAATHPGAAETCNRIDDDCSLATGAGGVDPAEDADLDGHARVGAACSGGFPADDCRDTDASIHPDAPELCNRIDDDCSLATGAGGVDVAEDADDDGFAPPTFACTGGPRPATDCDDTRAATYPGAPEACDAIDSNCDGNLDGPDVTALSCAATGQVCLAGECATVTSIAGGAGHTCIVTSRGRVLCWGDNTNGLLGVGSSAALEPLPRVVPGIADALTVTAGATHTCVRTTANAVRCWGGNAYGQLGDGTRTARTTPGAVSGLGSVSALDAGPDGACAATAAGGLFCWGRGGASGSAADRLVPTAVAVPTSFDSVLDVSMTATHACALVAFGTATPQAFCWGSNHFGRLGSGNAANDNFYVPERVGAVLDAPRDIEVGGSGGWLMTSSAYGWGDNTAGAVGDGTMMERRAPVAIGGGRGLSTLVLSSGSAHTCARRSDGVPVCWGFNERGQLGVGDATMRSLPTEVLGLSTVFNLAAGAEHTCATNGRTLWCWGANTTGQLGRAPTALPMSVSPVAVPL